MDWKPLFQTILTFILAVLANLVSAYIANRMGWK